MYLFVYYGVTSFVCVIIHLDFELILFLDLLKCIVHVKLLLPALVSLEHFGAFHREAQLVQILFNCFFALVSFDLLFLSQRILMVFVKLGYFLSLEIGDRLKVDLRNGVRV